MAGEPAPPFGRQFSVASGCLPSLLERLYCGYTVHSVMAYTLRRLRSYLRLTFQYRDSRLSDLMVFQDRSRTNFTH